MSKNFGYKADELVHERAPSEPGPGGGRTLPDSVGYSEYKRDWLRSVWENGGPYQGGPRDDNGILAAYLGTDIRAQLIRYRTGNPPG